MAKGPDDKYAVGGGMGEWVSETSADH